MIWTLRRHLIAHLNKNLTIQTRNWMLTFILQIWPPAQKTSIKVAYTTSVSHRHIIVAYKQTWTQVVALCFSKFQAPFFPFCSATWNPYWGQSGGERMQEGFYVKAGPRRHTLLLSHSKCYNVVSWPRLPLRAEKWKLPSGQADVCSQLYC